MLSFTMVSRLLLALLGSMVYAIPTKVVRDVVAPPITYPTAGVVWTVGSKEKVTWDTSAIPSRDSSATGMLLLGWLDATGENLQIDNPIQQNITLLDGVVTITVPDVPERDNYILCLIGDSGNITPPFTIKGGHGSASPPASSGTGPSTQSGSSTTLLLSSTKNGPPITPGSSSFTSSVSNKLTPPNTPSTLSPPTTPSSSSSGTNLPFSTGKTSAARAILTPSNLLCSVLTISLVTFFV